MINSNAKESIKFSVLIPVYNVEEYIEDCLDSVLRQTYSNYEIIITNDGSTDRSGQICDNYAYNDERIRVYNQENKGLLLARRNSIAHSTGEYCLFLDSDDSWKTNTLEVIYNTIMDTRADMVIFNWDRVTGNKVITSEPLYENKQEFSGSSKNEIIERFITTNKLNSLCLKAVKTNIIDKENDYSFAQGLTMGEDAIQSIPLFLNSQKIIYIQDSLYNYRMNEDSATNAFNPRHIKDLNIADGLQVKLVKEINRLDLLNVVSIGHINVVAKQIMLASVSNMSKNNKIKYFKEIRISDLYIKTKSYYQPSELLLPVRIIINELDKKNYRNVLILGKLYNRLWNNLGRMQDRVREKARNK
ncbi:glycosyltransferase family 2 protein [Aerococcus urinaeequi]|uniref:glycosyltransferase family 2 protein n=1 Tax=Aerococcus urinaeequi TaxID=51665 RepID=UPI003ED850B7